jgi:hypothetical protein
MPLTITLLTAGELPSPEAVQRWLTEQGEPFELHDEAIALRALPLRIRPVDHRHLEVVLASRIDTAVTRAVDLVFDLSVLAGADVEVDGESRTRATLWLRLADEQDRLRIAEALDTAAERGVADEVLRRLWAVLNALYPTVDARWNANQRALVALDERDNPVLLHAEADDEVAALVPRRLPGTPHLLVWRWLSEAWPSLVES